eukprot:1749313-Alexandrium_andersonii.AAC.1
MGCSVDRHDGKGIAGDFETGAAGGACKRECILGVSARCSRCARWLFQSAARSGGSWAAACSGGTGSAGLDVVVLGWG